MLYVFTLFDENRESRPLISGVYDPDTKSAKFYTFYLPHSGKSLYDIERDAAEFGQLLCNSKQVLLNDYKSHILSFDIPSATGARVFDVDMPYVRPRGSLKACKKLIAIVLGKMRKIKPQYWQIISADAAKVYGYLQRRGVVHEYQRKYPVWRKTYSGRSSSVGFSIQGLGKEDLYNPNNDKIYVNFDWVAADMRAVAIMSGDAKLEMTFNGSDPYEVLVDYFNMGVSDDKLTRGEGKRLMFKSVYSLDSDNPALDFYSGFREWIIDCQARLRSDGGLKSILGRRFTIMKDRTERSVFNAAIQGSVAHAMQICLSRVWKLYPENVLTENHDSLVMTCSKPDVANIIRDVARIMVQPFKGILKNNPQFPVVASIGFRYKNWKQYKRYDNYEQIG